MLAASVSGGEIWLGLAVAGIPLLGGFVAWVATLLVKTSTNLASMERRVTRIEDELWPPPSPTVRTTLRREVVTEPTPPAAAASPT